MSATKLRWGVLGVAKINQQVIPAIHDADNAEMYGIASRSLEKAQQAAKHYNAAKSYGSYEALLDDPDVDVIYNPLPNSLHDVWTRNAIEKGKHVLCEKPLCPTADEAQALVDFCESKNLKLLDNFMWPHHPRTAEIRKQIDDGTIGEVRHVSTTFSFPMDMSQDNIRLESDLAGGSLLDIGCYPVYGIRWAMGSEPLRAFATAKFVRRVDLEMSAVLEFDNDRAAIFDCAFTRPYRGWFEITGDKGVIRVPNFWQPDDAANWIVTRLNEAPREHVIRGENHRVHVVQNFGRAILNDEPVTPSMDNAVNSLRVMDALLTSARDKTVVSL